MAIIQQFNELPVDDNEITGQVETIDDDPKPDRIQELMDEHGLTRDQVMLALKEGTLDWGDE